jgi:hypothetical protein
MDYQQMYEATFNAKIDYFQDYDFYPRLRKQADEALIWHTGFGVNAISAIDFMNRIIVMPSTEIEKWQVGQSELRWTKEQIDYDTDKLAMEVSLRFVEFEQHKNNEGEVQKMSDNTTAMSLAENEYVKELFAILQDNGRDTSGLAALLGHVDGMESFIKRAEDRIADMKSQLAEMKEVQNHPVKNALQNTIKTLETKVAEVKERIGELQANIVAGCKNAVVAFKDKGISALDKLAGFFHIKSGLKALDKSVAQSVDVCDNAVVKIDNFAREYHAAGRAIKNMGRMFVGKSPIDAKRETGKLARAVSAPYKAEKAILLEIRGLANAMVNRLDNLEKTVETRQAQRALEKKPSMLDELHENLQLLAQQKLEMPVQERAKVKGTEL